MLYLYVRWVSSGVIVRRMLKPEIEELLVRYAEQYETAEFLNGDPSWFMHQVDGVENKEAMAFIASVLSYGSRTQFMPKIQLILECSGGEVDTWLRQGHYAQQFGTDDNSCFYRLYTHATMNGFLRAYQQLLTEHGTLGSYVSENATDGLSAVECICRWFREHGGCGVIPKDAQSACKRVCMFLRWMVRANSPVDLGLWSSFIDRRTLVIPMDTHVLSEAGRLGLINGRTATMSAALRLTHKLAEIFPEDPLKGDFALFGYGVRKE